MWSLLFLLSIVVCISGKNEEYMGYKVYNVKFENEAQAERLEDLKNDVIDFWRKPSWEHDVVGRAMVPPSHIEWFENQLVNLGITRDVFVEDVYRHLEETELSLTRTIRNDPERVFGFDGYYRYDEILAYINTLQSTYANTSINIEVEEYGRTENNRPLVYLRISNSDSSDESKPVVIIDSGIIPREWITIPASLNIVNKILGNETNFLERADWIVVPVINPDGYEYTHTNLRLWTKSLSTHSNLGFICPGVNINRNFDIGWGVSDSSSSPCSHLFAGVESFSEIESQMIKYLIDTYNERIKLYVSLHNSGGFVSYPWQYERAASGMFRQKLFLGMEIVNAMNDDYRLDVGWSALGDTASGTSSDFAMKSGVLYSWNIDIVERGDDGVNVPENEIVDVIEDVWRAVSVAANAVI